MSSWLFNLYMDAVMKEVKMGMGVRIQEEVEERLAGLLYPDDMVLCGNSEEDQKVKVVSFVEVYRRRDLKVNADKSKVMPLSGKKKLECEVLVNGT